MAKLKGLTVRGYQSHVDSYFPFAPGLTVITGASDGGKTGGTIRVLRWLAQGEPSGDDFLHTLYDPTTGEIRSQAEQTQVIAEMDDGVTIEKIRRKKKTIHKISTIEEPFEKADTPDEVKQILGINLYNFGDFEAALNFAYQLEPPFLISESPSAGAKVLGKLAGTEDVDTAIKSVSKDTHAVRKQRDAAKANVEKYTGDLLDYLFLEDAIKAAKTCEDIMVLVDQQDAKRSELLRLSGAHDQHTRAVQGYDDRLAIMGGIEQARSSMDLIEDTIQRHIIITDLATWYQENADKIQRIDGKLAGLQTIHGVDVMIQGVEFYLEKLEDLKKLSTNLSTYQQTIGRSDQALVKTKDLDLAEEKLQQITESTARLDTIKQLHINYESSSRHLQTAAATVEKYKDLPGDDRIRAIESKLAQLKDLEALRELLRIADQNIVSRNVQEAEAIAALERAEKELHEAWIATGGTCPLCEQEIINL